MTGNSSLLPSLLASPVIFWGSWQGRLKMVIIMIMECLAISRKCKWVAMCPDHHHVTTGALKLQAQVICPLIQHQHHFEQLLKEGSLSEVL